MNFRQSSLDTDTILAGGLVAAAILWLAVAAFGGASADPRPEVSAPAIGAVPVAQDLAAAPPRAALPQRG